MSNNYNTNSTMVMYGTGNMDWEKRTKQTEDMLKNPPKPTISPDKSKAINQTDSEKLTLVRERLRAINYWLTLKFYSKEYKTEFPITIEDPCTFLEAIEAIDYADSYQLPFKRPTMKELAMVWFSLKE